MPTVISFLLDIKVFLLPIMRYIIVNEAPICWELGTPQLLPYSGDRNRFVTMLRSKGQQGQFSLRKALTVATMGGHSYMKR